MDRPVVDITPSLTAPPRHDSCARRHEERPSGSHAQSRSVEPGGAMTSGVLAPVIGFSSLTQCSPVSKRSTKLMELPPGMRRIERPTSLATTVPLPVDTGAV